MPQSLAAGTSVGHYTIVAPLGTGGMGEVYKAHDPTLQRTVAIKVLKAQAEDAASRILTEARAASGLSHPNICVIHEVGEADGQSFIVMEHVEGKPLSELIPSDGLPPESVIRYGTQIADALAHAHEHGIVHRDLKSANVVITPEAQVKLIDFGIAVPLASADADAVTRTMESPVSSAPVGTLAYMAPEVLNGQEATARSDIWSLGALLYEMASGRLPFEGETPLDVVSAIAKETPKALPSRVSAGFRSVVQRCLQKEPGSRYSSPAVVQGALETTQSDTAQLHSSSRQGAVMLTWRMPATVVGLLVVSAVLFYYVRPATSPTARSSVPRLANPVQITTGSFLVTEIAWSPDEAMMAYSANQNSKRDIWIAPLGGQPLNRTADYAGDYRQPAWSPDGQEIAFRSDRDGGGIFVMSALAGSPRKLSSAGQWPEWSPDGLALCYRVAELTSEDPSQVASLSAHLEILTLQTGETRRIELPGRSLWPYQFAWSPDGRYLAYIEGAGAAAEVNQVWILRLEDGQGTAVTDHRSWNATPSWSTDGLALSFVSNRRGSRDLWRQQLSEARVPEGEPARLSAGVGMYRAAWSPSGTKLAYVQGGRISDLWRIPLLDDRPATWADATQLTFDRAYIEGVDVSSDGTRLLLTSDRTGNADLWNLPADGGDMQQLTTDPTPDWGPRLSPDGTTVVFYAYRSGNRDIFAMPVAGGTARQLTETDHEESFPAWSPDGTQLVVESWGLQRVPTLDILDVATGDRHQLVELAGKPAWSPDGRWVAFGRGGQIWRIAATGGDAELLTSDGGSVPLWKPDGSQIYFRRQQRNWWAVSPDGNDERQVTDFSGKPGRLGALSSGTDGAFLYFPWMEDQGDIWVMDVVQDEE